MIGSCSREVKCGLNDVEGLVRRTEEVKINRRTKIRYEREPTLKNSSH